MNDKIPNIAFPKGGRLLSPPEVKRLAPFSWIARMPDDSVQKVEVRESDNPLFAKVTIQVYGAVLHLADWSWEGVTLCYNKTKALRFWVRRKKVLDRSLPSRVESFTTAALHEERSY